MATNTRLSNRTYHKGCFYNTEDFEKGIRNIVAIAPYGVVNKYQNTKPVREALIVKGL